MSAAGFLRLGKLIGAGKTLVAARHNLRAIQAEMGAGGSIDATRSHLNYRLAGPDSPEAVAELARERMATAGVTKMRKDGVRAIEAIFSLPAGADLDERAYFADCVAWAAARFTGPDNVMSADVHLDESQRHLHVLILPLVGGRMVGSDLVGGPAKLKAHQAAFYDAVASRYGLRRAPARLRGEGKATAAAAVLGRLRELNDPALRSATWATLRDAIERDPAPWAMALGIDLDARTPRRMKTMAQIFTSPGKGGERGLSTRA